MRDPKSSPVQDTGQKILNREVAKPAPLPFTVQSGNKVEEKKKNE